MTKHLLHSAEQDSECSDLDLDLATLEKVSVKLEYLLETDGAMKDTASIIMLVFSKEFLAISPSLQASLAEH